MKASELKFWKWDGEDYVFADRTTAEVTLTRPTGRGLSIRTSVMHDPALTSEVLFEAARIALHYEKTGRFAPDPEEPTIKQAKTWLERNQDWRIVDIDGLRFHCHHESGALIQNVLQLDAIARLSKIPYSELVAEMLNL